jgi:glycerol-3-phosphate acyltransferase PlsY
VFTVLAPPAAAVAGGAFVVAIWATRYVSVGSMTAAVMLAVTSAAGEGLTAVSVGAVIAAIIIIERHRANLRRLAAGTERRIGQRI